MENNFHNKKILVTAGPTYEPIDPVRFIGNYSSGKMGFAVAGELADRGANVLLVTGPSQLTLNLPEVEIFSVQTAEEMFSKCNELFPECSGAVLAAAVADFTPEKPHKEKIKKGDTPQLILKLKQTKDILAYLGEINQEHQFLVGFSMETDHAVENARKKVQHKKLDFIVMNNLLDQDSGFAKDTNKITIIDKIGKITPYQTKSKKDAAKDIINYLDNYLSQQ